MHLIIFSNLCQLIAFILYTVFTRNSVFTLANSIAFHPEDHNCVFVWTSIWSLWVRIDSSCSSDREVTIIKILKTVLSLSNVWQLHSELSLNFFFREREVTVKYSYYKCTRSVLFIKCLWTAQIKCFWRNYYLFC